MDIQKLLPSSIDAENYARYEDPKLPSSTTGCCARTIRPPARGDARPGDPSARHRGARAVVLWCTGSCRTALPEGAEVAPTHFINQDLARLWLDK